MSWLISISKYCTKDVYRLGKVRIAKLFCIMIYSFIRKLYFEKSWKALFVSFRGKRAERELSANFYIYITAHMNRNEITSIKFTCYEISVRVEFLSWSFKGSLDKRSWCGKGLRPAIGLCYSTFCHSGH